MARPQDVRLTLQHYDYGWNLQGCGGTRRSNYADETAGDASLAVEDPGVSGIIFNKQAFAGALEFTDQQVNLHHHQQLGLASKEAAPLLQFDAVAFILAESIEKCATTLSCAEASAPPPTKLKWDAVVLVGRELESYLVKFFRCALLCANHGGRAGVESKDFGLARQILGESAA